jgi:hypothetical protein
VTARQLQQKLKRHWGSILAVLSAALYGGVSVAKGYVPDETKLLAIMGAVTGIANWWAERNKSDTEGAVEKTVNFQALLAGMEVSELLDKLENKLDRKQESHHQQNTAKLNAILAGSAESDRLHAEHISVTDSLERAVTVLVDEVVERNPEFPRPVIVQRERSQVRTTN